MKFIKLNIGEGEIWVNPNLIKWVEDSGNKCAQIVFLGDHEEEPRLVVTHSVLEVIGLLSISISSPLDQPEK